MDIPVLDIVDFLDFGYNGLDIAVLDIVVSGYCGLDIVVRILWYGCCGMDIVVWILWTFGILYITIWILRYWILSNLDIADWILWSG